MLFRDGGEAQGNFRFDGQVYRNVNLEKTAGSAWGGSGYQTSILSPVPLEVAEFTSSPNPADLTNQTFMQLAWGNRVSPVGGRLPLVFGVEVRCDNADCSAGLPLREDDSGSIAAPYFEVRSCTTAVVPISGGGGSQQLDVPFAGAIDDLDLSVRIVYPGIWKLSVDLTHVDTGTTARVFDGLNAQCQSGEFMDVTLDDEASNGIQQIQCSANSTTFSGPLQPAAALAGFDGESLEGQWRLTVEDPLLPDEGSIIEWCISGRVYSGLPGRDLDGDGIVDTADNCVLEPNTDQTDSNADGVGDVCDLDSDGAEDGVDNCRGLSNPQQLDSDGDGFGDLCDVCVNDPDNDLDADDICGDVDNCPFVSNSNQQAIPFGQTILATGPATFGWPSATEVRYLVGDFTSSADIGSFVPSEAGSGTANTLSADPSPVPGGGRWYLVAFGCTAGSYSSGGAGEQPGRDQSLGLP